jgi:inner membrane protein
LDAMTDGGLGIALLSPFDNHRYFFPWTPIVVSPIGLRGFFSNWGLRVMISEITYVWAPLLICLFAIRLTLRKFWKRALLTTVPDN